MESLDNQKGFLFKIYPQMVSIHHIWLWP